MSSSWRIVDGNPAANRSHGLTDPPAWVDADENILGAFARVFKTVSATVSAQLDKAKNERLEMFEGATIWSGAAAVAANGLFGARIGELESRRRVSTIVSRFSRLHMLLL